MEICKNCGNSFDLSYCNACGQKTAHRLDAGHIFHEGIHVFTHADKSIFRFIPKLIVYPGIIALDYVNGKRKSQFNLFQYVIIVAGLVVFFFNKTHILEDGIKQLNDPNLSKKITVVQGKIMQFLQNYFNIIMLVLIPAFAFFSRLFFKKRGYNYAENIVLECSIQAQQNTISLISMILLYFAGAASIFQIIIIPLFIAITAKALAYRQFFKSSWLESILKAILVYACVYIIQMIVVMIVMFVWVLTMKK